MKSMKNFAAQQLNKKQMNVINGGQRVDEDLCGTLYYCEWEGDQNYACEKTGEKVILEQTGAICNPV